MQNDYQNKDDFYKYKQNESAISLRRFMPDYYKKKKNLFDQQKDYMIAYQKILEQKGYGQIFSVV